MDNNESILKPPPLWGSSRLTLVIMCFNGAALLMILRFNFSMAIVCMTEKEAEFTWEKSTQGYLLSSFFYGYICTQIIGGFVSDKFGGKFSLLGGMLIMSFSSLALPTFARLDVNFVMVIRILQGLVSGVAFPSLYNLFAVWSSPEERATLMSIVFSGIAFANIVNLPLSAGLCATGIDGGWPMVFYVPGSLGLIWSVIFHLTCFSSPMVHPRISETEKTYLINSCQEKNRDRRTMSTPLWSMMKSMSVHALWITHMCHAWGYYLVAVNLTLYGRDVLKLDVVANGVLSCLPYVGMFIMTLTAKIFDQCRKKEYLPLSTLRKIFTSLGMIIPAVCMTSLHLVGSKDVIGNVALLTIGMSGHHLAATGGYYLSHSDIAGPFSGTLFGITNTMAQVPGFANALIVAHLTPNGTREEWLLVFDIASVIFIIGCLIYVIFGTSNLQPWAKSQDKEFHAIDEETNALENQHSLK